MNVLITGSSGFLASNLLKHLDKAYNICLTGRSNSHSKYRFQTYEELFRLNEKFDVVFHLASHIPKDMKVYDKQLLDVNVDLTSKLVNKFPDSLFVYASSVSVYGNNMDLINEHTQTNPETLYAYSKLIGEHLVKQLNNYRIVRFSSLYGPEMKGNTFLPLIVESALNNKKINLWGEGKRLQNYIEVNDASEYLLKGLACKKNGIYLGTGTTEISNKELAELICNYVDDVVISFINEDNSPSYNYNNTLTQKELNWKPGIDLSNGIKKYITWKKK